MKLQFLTMSLLAASIALTACNDHDNDQYVSTPSIPENNITNPVVSTPVQYTKTDFNGVAGESVMMTYKMLGIQNKEVQATSLVFTPNTAPPVSGWPIVVWAHGTTGVADQCAPSRSALNPYIQQMITGFLNAGYVVVAPDYEGLGEPGGKELHPFLDVKSEAYSITDAVVAARSYLGAKTSRQWVAVGHSQGGQAALGAAQYASRAKLEYKGTVAVAPASNLQLILVGGENQAGAETDLGKKINTLASLDTFTALITAGLRNPNPDLQYSQVFKTPTDQIAQSAETDCYDVLGKKFGAAMLMYAQNNNGSIESYPRTQSNFMSIPAVNQFLQKDSQPLQVKISTPVIIYQGSLDTTVPKQATDVLVALAKQKQTSVRYLTDDNSPNKWNHSSAYAANISNIVEDVKTLLPIQ